MIFILNQIKTKVIRLRDILNELKERSIPDLSSKEGKKLKLKKGQFNSGVFSKGFPPDKKFAVILIKTDSTIDVFATNNNINTSQRELTKWQKDYAYKNEVSSWEIIPMKTIEI
jgi:hypothetical protein